MSFHSPLWLLVLAVIPLAVAAYLLRRRRGQRYVVRHPGAAIAAAAVAASPRWQRHIPAALLLAAVAMVTIALARPRVTHHVPTESASLMLVTDHSGSMAADDVSPNRLAAAISAANTFIDQLPSTVKVGAIGFGNSPDAIQSPDANHKAARAVIDGQQAVGGTDTGAALQLALQLLHGSDAHHPPAAIVLLSDGAANLGPDPVSVSRTAAAEHIPIYTVALGTESGVLSNGLQTQPVPPDPQLMAEIAKVSGARAFNAQSSDQLSTIYKRLGSELSTVTRKKDITTVFVIAGAVFLLAGAAASVRTSGRIV